MSRTMRVFERIRAEFLEMPGLRLKPEQVQRLCGVEQSVCKHVLDSLVDREFLCIKPDGAYATPSACGGRPRPSLAGAPISTRPTFPSP